MPAPPGGVKDEALAVGGPARPGESLSIEPWEAVF